MHVHEREHHAHTHTLAHSLFFFHTHTDTQRVSPATSPPATALMPPKARRNASTMYARSLRVEGSGFRDMVEGLGCRVPDLGLKM
jgi:hypothetical protein